MPAEPVVFPAWARIALGCVVALVGYLVAGDAIHISEGMRGLISSLTLLLASAGIVPPKPSDIRLSQTTSLFLTAVVIVAGYVLNTLVDLEPIIRGLIIAALALASSIGIVPPQGNRQP